MLHSPIGEPQYASAQPTTSVANPWNPPQRRRIVLMRHGAVTYFDAQGKPFEMTGEDLLARAFLHETDHLNGRLYISHISPLKRDLIRRKIRKLQKANEWG